MKAIMVLVFMAMYCGLYLLHCHALSASRAEIETNKKNEEVDKLNRKPVLIKKKKNDETYADYTAFPPLSEPDKKDLSSGIKDTSSLTRVKRSNETDRKIIASDEKKPVKNVQLKEYVIGRNKNSTFEAKNGTVGTIERRLIMGRDAFIEDYPYVVSIQKDGEHWCGGALLTGRIVLTTANCVWKSKTESQMKVRLGSRNTNTGGTVASIIQVLKHPRWSVRKDPDCDIALLLLDTKIRFSDGLHPAELPNESMLPPFNDVWVTSWGSERPDGVYKGPENRGLPLQVYQARLLDHALCNNITSRYGVNVTDNFICVAQQEHKAPCTRDTGAPAVSDGVIWGLASWGLRKTCGTVRSPAMFSYVASPDNLDFITTASAELMSRERANPYRIED